MQQTTVSKNCRPNHKNAAYDSPQNSAKTQHMTVCKT